MTSCQIHVVRYFLYVSRCYLPQDVDDRHVQLLAADGDRAAIYRVAVLEEGPDEQLRLLLNDSIHSL